MRIPRTVALSAVLAVSLALVGCSGPPASVIATPSAEPSMIEPTTIVRAGFQAPNFDPEMFALLSEQARETGLTPPSQVFRGNCSNLFLATDLSEIIGQTMVAVPTNDLASDQGRAIELHGGIRCQWKAAEGTELVDVVAVPDGLVNDHAHWGCDVLLENNALGCTLDSAGAWIRVSGIAVTNEAGETKRYRQQISIVELWWARVKVADLAPLPKPAVEAWAFPVDCAAIVAAANLSKVPGLGADSTGSRTKGSEPYYPQAEIALWGGTEPGPCTITGESVKVEFTALGGARYYESTIAATPKATALAVAGLDSVFVTPAPNGRSRIDVFDGPNWLTFSVRYVKNAGPLAKALVASLDATAVD